MATNRKPANTRSFTPMQDDILKVATDAIGPAVAVRIVSKKLADAGVRLTTREKRKLREAIVSGSIDEFSRHAADQPQLLHSLPKTERL